MTNRLTVACRLWRASPLAGCQLPVGRGLLSDGDRLCLRTGWYGCKSRRLSTRFIAISIFNLSILQSSIGQDIHFSQFTQSPQLQSAGWIGGFEGAGIIYRNQWRSIDEPFATLSAFGETYLDLGFDRIGLGATLLHDKAGPGQLLSSQVWLGASYHLNLGRTTLTAAVQPGFVKRSIQPVTYPNDYDPSIGDFQLSAGSSVPPANYFDLNAGMILSLPLGQSKLHVGQSIQHLVRPRNSFFGNPDERLAMRATTWVGMDAPIATSLRLKPSLLFSKHNGATEVNLQSRLYYELNAAVNNLVTGIGMRNNTTGVHGDGVIKSSDAAFLIGGFTYRDTEFSMSYDFNISGLHEASSYRGAFELAIIWKNTRRVSQGQVVVPCIRI